eukprot:jgi/Phyca11/574118/estExt2_Genewise1.C_PHYCAscaffold_590181
MDALDGQGTTSLVVNPTHVAKKRKIDVVPPPSAKKKLPSWLKRKQELESLRQQTQAMETRVLYLEMKNSSTVGGLNAFERFKLESFAKEEKQKCITAQNENKRLKATLLLYVKRYEAWQEMARRQEELLKILSGALRVETGAARQLQICGAHVFDMMEGKLDASPVSGKWTHKTREGGCFAMRDYAANVTPGICQARSFICLYPGENEEKAQNDSRAASNSIRQVVVPSFRQLTLSRHQFMENALFDNIRS